MYCKNCGKDLPDNARFCDKCNMSVRKKERKMDMIEELKEERLARQKAHEIEARLKKIKRVKRKRYKAIAYCVLGIALVWGAIVAISFWRSSKDSMNTDKAEYAPSPTPVVATPKPKQEIYMSKSVEEMSFILLKEFYPLSECSGIAGYSDGTAVLVINKEETTLSSKELMDIYVDSIPNAVPDDKKAYANDKGYTITLVSGVINKHHKKCIIKDGIAFSYELLYPAEDAEKYEKHIEKMDEKFTVS